MSGLGPLTVGFHEPQFLADLAAENRDLAARGFWFQRTAREQRESDYPWGPLNPQALSGYGYCLANPLRYVDPSGHATISIHQGNFVWNRLWKQTLEWHSMAAWRKVASVGGAVVGGVAGALAGFVLGSFLGPAGEVAGVALVGFLGEEATRKSASSLFDRYTGNAVQIRKDLKNICGTLDRELSNAQKAGQGTIDIRIVGDRWGGFVVVIGDQEIAVTEETILWLREQGFDW